MPINILYKTGSPGIVTVGTYTTNTDPTYDTYYSTQNIDVGITTATSVNVSGMITSSSLNVSGMITSSSLVVSGITTVGLGTTSSPLNSQLSFELTSNTNLRIKVRGSDGILRSANITLA
jgi:hypothetical protein